MISYCFQYFSLCLGGIILELIFRDKKKNKKKEDDIVETETKSSFSFSFPSSNSRTLSKASNNYIFHDKNKRNDFKYFVRIFLVYSLYYFAKIAMTSFDNIGYNRVKYWPLEFIFLYLFAKKILNKTFYMH